ncbi:hypothetical protein PAMA_013444 [Pampus argenteus]
MEQRRVNLLQLKMFLLVVRMSALTLLLSLLFVSMATAESTCQQEIPTELIRELWSSTRLLINKLPVSSSEPSKRFNSIKKLEKKIKKELKQPEIGSNPLFSSVIRSINTSCQRKEDVLLMNATLDVYMRIFSSILQRSHSQRHEKSNTPALLDQLSDARRDQVTRALVEFQQKLGKLKRRLSHLGRNKEDVINKLNNIKVDDPVDQRKALAEFKEIYQAASVIGSCGPAHSS